MYLGVLIPLSMCGRHRATVWSQYSPSLRGQNSCCQGCKANVLPLEPSCQVKKKNYILIKSIKTHWTSEAKALSYSESYEKSSESLAKSNIGSLLQRTLQRKDLQGQFI